MTYDSPRAAMRQGIARQRGLAPTSSIAAATQSQRPPEPTPPPAVSDFIQQAYAGKDGNKMTAAEWRSTANTAVQTHGYDAKDLQREHSGMLQAGQIKRSRVRFTGYQWNHDHNGGK